MNRSETERLNAIVRDANALLINGPNEKAPHLTNVAVLEAVLDDVQNVVYGALKPSAVAAMLAEDNDARKCRHTWVGGMCFVHDEDAESVNAERVANGLKPLECQNCDAAYPGE